MTGIVAGCVCAAGAFAQSWPGKPIRIVSGFAPGGGGDIMARVLTPKLVEAFGQQILIESRPGAGTNIAIEHVIKSPPDGYTLLMSSPAVAINMSLYRKLPFDTTRDLATIAVFSQTPNLLVVDPSLPVRTVKDLIALARAEPGALNYSYGGSGTTQHLSGELFKLRTGTRMLSVAYKGTQPSMTALLGGEVELTIANIPSVIEFVKARRLRALASTAVERTALFAQIPTMREAGIDMVVNVWYTLHAPAATPRDIVQRIAEVTVKAARPPDTFAGSRTWVPSPSATCRRTQPGSCATKSLCGLRWSRLPEHRRSRHPLANNSRKQHCVTTENSHARATRLQPETARAAHRRRRAQPG